MLFTFPSRYWYTIGLIRVFSLAGWARQIHTGLLVSRATQDTAMPSLASDTGLSPPMVRLSSRFSSQSKYNHAVLQPRPCIATRPVWALPRSLATTGGIIRLFSLPGGTKMFQFPPFASLINKDRYPSDTWVVPFGNPRVKGYLRLTAAYRSLSRPSSPE